MDGSEHAAAAVEAAGALAAVWEAAVDVVGVHRFLQPEHSEVTASVRAAAQTLRAGGLSVHAHLRRGARHRRGAAEENARLIVVGAGERGRLARRIIGASPTGSPSARPAMC